MKSGKPIIYWDSCIFLAWLKDENRPNREMDGVYDVANKIHKDNVILITSTFTRVEILESTLDDTAKQRLTDLFKRRNFQQVAPDNRIMDMSHEIRDYYQKQKDIDQLPTLTTPDAIHLATAIIHGVSEFHTFDENDEPRKRRALLPLNGNVAGHPLVICKPPIPPQQGLFNEKERT